jgi:molybdate transport system permease protein
VTTGLLPEPATAGESRRSSAGGGHVGSRGASWLRTPLPWLAALLGAYLLVPIGAFVVRLASATGTQLSSPGTGAALAVSVETASITAVIVAVFGVPLAYVLARGRSRTSSVLGILVQLPIALPPLMSGILLLYVVGPYSHLGRLFDGRLTDDRVGIILAQTFVAAPFVIVAARSSFAALDPALDDVAATLGHGRWSRFARVAVPAAMPGIGAGLLLAWLRAFGEFGATVVLAYHPYSLPVLTYVQFGSTGLDATLLPTAAALGSAVALVAGFAGVARARRSSRPPGVQVPVPAPVMPLPRFPSPLSFDVTGHLGSFRAHTATTGDVTRLAIIGASGAGKTFALRMLAGLVAPTAARVTLGGTELDAMPPEVRQIGYLPQDSALLPHLTSWQQVTFGVGTDPAVAAYWMSSLGVADLSGRRPHELSGGQRRRIALARALSRSPRLLLLDEPFTGLDTPVRDELRRELRRLQRETGTTTVIVTHDPDDAALLAEHVMVVGNGNVLQLDTLAAVRDTPASPQVARLLGIRNVGTATVVEAGVIGHGDLRFACETDGLRVGESVIFRVDPRRLDLGGAGQHTATVVDVVEYGDRTEVDVRMADGISLIAVLPAAAEAGSRMLPEVGTAVAVSIEPGALRCWPAT